MSNQNTQHTEDDQFEKDWAKAKEFWKEKHKVFDFAYLQYKSILTFNNVYGQDYLRAFGMKVFVPLTFQTVESIAAVINRRKIEFVVNSTNKKDERKEKYLQTLDNIEWARSKCGVTRTIADKYALIYGTGYFFNPYLDDTVERHFPKTKKEEQKTPQDPEDGQEQTDEPNIPKGRDIEWEKRKITRYRGMKPRALNPYYVFPDASATSDEDWRHCYVYTVMTVDELKEFAVGNNWISEEEAEKTIVEGTVEYFDDIKDTIDQLFNEPLTKFTRGDHTVNVTHAKTPNRRSQEGMVAIIERFEEDNYEVRIAGQKKTLYKDHNIYPHKQIPIIPVWDYKLPQEFAGMGEPEVIRWQQLEVNKIHNLLLDSLLLAVAQRYAVRQDLLKDPHSINFSNPFKPVLLKALPGLTVNQAFMPLPQPDVKRSPFMLMDLVKETIQQTTGATDFITSTNESQTDTATESNNLVAATTNRIREKIRQMDEVSLAKLVEQWHACYPLFYTEELDYRLRGEKGFVRYIPLDRREANESDELVQKAAKEMDATGATLEEVYLNAGYKQVLFLSDMMGEFTVEVEISDIELNEDEAINRHLRAIKTLAEVNTVLAETGDTRRFDVFPIAEQMVKQFPMVKEAEDLIVENQEQNLPTPESGAILPTSQNVNTKSLLPQPERQGPRIQDAQLPNIGQPQEVDVTI